MFGVDFGQTRTKRGYLDVTGRFTAALNCRGDPFTPSCVWWPPDGEPLVGIEAIEQGYVDPNGYADNFKLKLGTPEELLRNGLRKLAVDGVEAAVRAAKEDLERSLNTEITVVGATCPGTFRDHQKAELLEGYKRVGLEVIRLASEPAAAAAAFGVGRERSTCTPLVIDVGGGTTDVSVVRSENANMTILATEGEEKLGGNDIDEYLLGRVLAALEAECGRRPTHENDAMFFLDMRFRIEQAKFSLGTRPQVVITAAWEGHQVAVTVTQEEFHNGVRPLVQRVLDAGDRALANANLKKTDIDQLLLVGGTSRLPFLRRLVADHFGLAPRTDVDPDTAVVYGAALICAEEIVRQGRQSCVGGRIIPEPRVSVRDVTAHDVGCAVLDRTTERLINSVIIRKNTPIPCEQTDEFFLEREDQTDARIEVLQGEGEAERDGCLVIGTLNLVNLPKEVRRTRRIRVSYQIDRNGMVTVTATDKISGQSQAVSIDHKSGTQRGN